MLVRLSMRSTDQASDVPSIIFFIICDRLRALKILYFYYKKIEKLFETIFAKNFARKYETKIILGTSDAWLVVHLDKRTSVPL